MRAKFGVLEQTQGLHLPAKFHLNVFIVSASGDQKPQFWANFDSFGRSCTDPLIPMRAKFGVLEQTQGLHLSAKFRLNVFIVSASNGQKPQFWTNFDILGAPVSTPFTDEGQIWCAIADPRSTFTCKILYRSVYSVVLWRRKKHFCRFLPSFRLRHSVMSPMASISES